jgi:lysophospholipase L1-like esterase
MVFTRALVLGLGLVVAGFGQGTHWVTSWASAQQQPRAPRTGPAPAFTGLKNQTARMIVRTSVGGPRIRVELSNVFGTAPLVVGSAAVALQAKGSAIVAGSSRALTFNGATSVTIPVGVEMFSDPVEMKVGPLANLAVSVFVPGETGPASQHSLGLHTTYVKEGDQTAAAEVTGGATTQSWYWVSAVDVDAPAKAATLVTFGDSITDGATSTPDTDRAWPSVLAARLQANPATAHIAVANLGISGNQVLGDGAGVSALARFDRDVLSQSNVKWMTLMEGINDIGLGAKQGTVSAAKLIAAYKQMIDRAHTHGIKVIGATLTPYVGAFYASPEGEAMREEVNAFIRTSGAFDAVVDFDKLTRDPANPKEFLKAFNDSDHLHPNDAGYKAMADSIDLSLFEKLAKR